MIEHHVSTRFQLLPLLVALGLGCSLSAQAQSLSQLYDAARSYDATYQSAKYQFDATLAKGEQSKAGLRPTVNLSASANVNDQQTEPGSRSNYDTQSGTLSVSQPLYRPANWATYQQGNKQAALAQTQLLAAEQDLLVRVSQAYFDVLASIDNLEFVKNQKTAVSEQLASANRNFEVGTSTITDTREAQARYDLVVAQEVAAENDLQVKSIALQQLVGVPTAAPKPLVTPAELGPLQPADVEQWVRDSETNHPGIKQLQVSLEVARLESDKARAGHKPTVDLTGSFTSTNNNGSSTTASNIRSEVSTVGVTLNLPLFAGFSVQNRLKETLALEEKARTDLEATKRTVAQATRTAYYGVQSGLAQVKALEAAEASSQSALDANKQGYQVGVRINIDVLNSQSQLFDTKAKLAKARYDVLVGGLKLRQANGTLQAADLEAVNGLLAR